MKIKIRLDTFSDAQTLATIASKYMENITITDGNGMRVNAKSVLGAIYATEFSELWLESEQEHWFDFKDFLVEE